MRRLVLISALALALTGVSAGTQIELQDGRVIDATEVQRDGDLYVIGLASGGSMTIPAALVREVRLTADRKKKKPPPGLTYAEPQQLAGPEVHPLRPSEAQAVFGEPSKFQANVIDPTWTPKSGFPEGDVLADSRSTWRPSIIDPNYELKSGFPDKDVLAGSRSTWSKGIDNTWVPEDGFKKKKLSWQRVASAPSSGARVRMTSARSLISVGEPIDLTASAHGGWYEGYAATRSGVPFRFHLSNPTTRTSTEVRDCARSVLQATGPVNVRALSDPLFSELPIDLYRATDGKDGSGSRAAFTMEGGTCRAISGDLRDPLGVSLTRGYALAQGVEAYDASLEDLGPVELKTNEDRIAYAFAVVSLIDPDVTGGREATLTLLTAPGELEALVAREAGGCAISDAKRKKAARKAGQQVKAPRVVGQGKREKIELFTWSSVDGEVIRHTVQVADSGKVSVNRKSIGAHVGAHADRD